MKVAKDIWTHAATWHLTNPCCHSGSATPYMVAPIPRYKVVSSICLCSFYSKKCYGYHVKYLLPSRVQPSPSAFPLDWFRVLRRSHVLSQRRRRVHPVVVSHRRHDQMFSRSHRHLRHLWVLRQVRLLRLDRVRKTGVNVIRLFTSVIYEFS
jgi:hypothetical protein